MGFSERLALAATNITISAESTLNVPASGSGPYYYGTRTVIKNGRGAPESPDSSTLYIRLLDKTGTAITANNRIYDGSGGSVFSVSGDSDFPSGNGWMQNPTEESTGIHEFFIRINDSDTADDLTFTLEVGWKERGVASRASHKFLASDVDASVAAVADQITTVDGIVDDILVDTSTTIPDTLTTIDGIVDDILTDTGTTLPATLSGIEGKVDTIDGIVDNILIDTNELQIAWTDGGRLDLILDELTTQGDTNEGKLDTIDTVVDALAVDLGDFSSNTNLQSNLAVLGTYGDDIDMSITEMLSAGMFSYAVVSSGVVLTHDNVTTYPTPNNTYTGDTSGTIYTFVADFDDDAAGTKLKSYWTYSGGTGPQVENISSDTDGDTDINVTGVSGGIKFQAISGGPTPFPMNDFYANRWMLVGNGTDQWEQLAIIDYDADATTLEYFYIPGVFGLLANISAGDTLVYRIDQPGLPFVSSNSVTGLDAINGTATTYISYLADNIIGDMSGDALTTLKAKLGDDSNDDSLHDKLGATGDSTTAGDAKDSVLALIGQPDDTLVAANDGTEGSLFAKLRDISTDLNAVAASSGSRMSQVTLYPALDADNTSNSYLTADPYISEIDSADGDGRVSDVDSSSTTVICFKYAINFPEDSTANIDAIFATLHWSSDKTGVSACTTYWAISATSETVGATPTSAVTDGRFTDASTALATKSEHTRSGPIPSAFAPATGDCYLYMIGTTATSTDTMDITVYGDTTLEITYHV